MLPTAHKPRQRSFPQNSTQTEMVVLLAPWRSEIPSKNRLGLDYTTMSQLTLEARLNYKGTSTALTQRKRLHRYRNLLVELNTSSGFWTVHLRCFSCYIRHTQSRSPKQVSRPGPGNQDTTTHCPCTRR